VSKVTFRILGLLVASCVCLHARASVNVLVNGSTYVIPQKNEKGWGDNVTTWIQAISAATLQPNGGTFTLTSDAYFGANFGLVSQYYKSPTTNISGTGILRLAKSDSIGWRNNANSSDLSLGINSSDQLTFTGGIVATSSAGTFSDSGFAIFNNSDNTKKVAVDASAVTTGTTRTLKMANANVDLANINASTITAGNLPSAQLPSTAIGISNGGTNNGSLGVDAGGVYYSDGTKIMNLAHGSSGNVLTSGGTGAPTWSSPLVNPMTTGGDIIYGGSAGAVTRLANGTSGQMLQSAGGTSAPSWQTIPGNTTALKAPTLQVFTSTGTRAAVQFIVTSANATAGATYTNNGNTYTVLQTIAAGTTLYASGAGAPLASGTLTKATGTGDATITFSAKTDLAQYTPPSGPAPIYVKIKGVGGGGGGGSSGTSGTNSGVAGKPSILIPATTFTSVIMSLGGGSGGTGAGGSGQPGGDPTINASSTVLLIESAGGGGGGGASGVSSSTQYSGGAGGNSALGGGGNSSGSGSSGIAKANTGAAGAGGGTGGTPSSFPGGGGGAGAYGSVMLVGAGVAPLFYAIGVKGTGGSAGTSGNAGGDGADGLLVFEEHYQ
jgi:hypothetical protein